MNRSSRKQLLITFIGIFVLLVSMVVYTLRSFYHHSVDKIQALGRSNLEAESAMIENYLNKGMDVLWVTADSVYNMMETGRTNEEILAYLTAEAEHEQEQVDENFTGIYGYINGEYMDGIGWEPPEGYIPQEREWYVAAEEAGGKPVIVAPYLDAQTNTIMISVSQMLPDGESVVSLDIALNEIQSLTESIQLNDMGYGFIIDETGLVIAHFDESEKGKVYPLNEEQNRMLEDIYSIQNGTSELTVDGERCTIFINRVMNDWYVVMVVSNTKLFEELRDQILINSVICLIVFAIIVAFCTMQYHRMLVHQKRDEESSRRMNELNTNIIRALAYTIDTKDPYTSGHSQRVANYSLEIAKRMGKSEEEQKLIYYAGLLHDVGKIRVSEEVINKPGRLTEEEFNLIKMHPVSGYHILKDIYEDKQIAFGAKYHHEKYDGTGYPNGLVGENIPEIARIIGVADAYDAMTSDRSYRAALSQDKVRSEFERWKGIQFDPNIANIMLTIIDEDKDYQFRQNENIADQILVIDDDDMAIEMVRNIIEENPRYKIFCAKTAQAAMDILDKQEIDLILLDVMMPDMNGFDLFAKIRCTYTVPIVFMTVDKSIDSILRAAKMGASDYVTKPFLPAALMETVHGVVNSWGEEDADTGILRRNF